MEKSKWMNECIQKILTVQDCIYKACFFQPTEGGILIASLG